MTTDGHGVRERFNRRAVLAGVAAVAFSVVMAFRQLEGVDLDLFLISATLSALMNPVLVTTGSTLRASISVSVAMTVGLGAGWATAFHNHVADVWVLFAALLVVGSFLFLQAVCTWGLLRLRFDVTVGSATVVVGSLVWLMWPVWATGAPPWAVRMHPLLVMNGLLADNFGVWTEQPVAYPAIALGQDVAYQLPTSPWPCVGAQLLTGGTCGLMLSGLGWDRRSPGTRKIVTNG